VDPDVQTLADMVAYQPGSVVSRKVLGGKRGNVTLFAFAEGEGLTEHTSPYDAMVVILDGEARIRVGDTDHTVAAGETMTLPADVPHALDAASPFKMMLVMIKDA
jgi:quercetin dioxygenase-like cupin family protein